MTTTINHYKPYPISPIFDHFSQYIWPYLINGSVNIDLQCIQSCWFVSLNHRFIISLKKIIWRRQITRSWRSIGPFIWKQKCIELVLISRIIHRYSSSFLISKEIWTDDAVGVYSAPNVQF